VSQAENSISSGYKAPEAEGRVLPQKCSLGHRRTALIINNDLLKRETAWRKSKTCQVTTRLKPIRRWATLSSPQHLLSARNCLTTAITPTYRNSENGNLNQKTKNPTPEKPTNQAGQASPSHTAFALAPGSTKFHVYFGTYPTQLKQRKSFQLTQIWTVILQALSAAFAAPGQLTTRLLCRSRTK